MDVSGRRGTVESVNIITDRETRRPRGFTSIKMAEANAAHDAIAR
jgi:RNA recognition motif-containing protein